MSYLPLVIALFGCSDPLPEGAATSVTLVYSSRLENEIEPCG